MPIYDTSYRRIEGVRVAKRLRFLPIAEMGLRLFFRRRLPKLLALAALLPFFGMLLIICGPYLLATVWPERLPATLEALLHLTGTGVYMYFTSAEWIFLLLFTALAGAGLIANDLRANALEIYFSRPLTLLDYFLGKLSVILAILLALTFVPCLLLWIVDVLLTEQDGFWLDQLHLLPRLLAASLVMSVPYGVIMLAISSLARTARNSMVVFAGLVLMTKFLGQVLTHVLDEPLYGLVSIDASIQRLVGLLLDPDLALLHAARQGVPLLDVPIVYPSLVLLAWVLFAVLTFFRRVKGVEIVST